MFQTNHELTRTTNTVTIANLFNATGYLITNPQYGLYVKIIISLMKMTLIYIVS